MIKQLKITQSITQRTEMTIQSYFDEIAKYPLMSAEEEFNCAYAIKNGKTQEDRDKALTKMVNSNLRFVVSVAKTYQNAGVSLMDLIQEGNVGLIQAANQFDETKGFKFISYAVWWIRQSVMKYLSDKKQTIRLPQNKIEMLQKIYSLSSVYYAEHGCDPTVEFLAEKSGFSVESIEGVMSDANTQSIKSFDAPVGDDTDTPMEELFDGGVESTDSKLQMDSIKDDLQRMVNSLSKNESFVLNHIYNLNDCGLMSREQVADCLDLTGERVRQIQNRALRKLQSRYGTRLKSLFAK